MSTPLEPIAFAVAKPAERTQVPTSVSRESAVRFEKLLYAPIPKAGAIDAASTLLSAGRLGVPFVPNTAAPGLRAYADSISAMWHASAERSARLLDNPQPSYRDLLVFQRDLGATLVSVEIASKTSGIVESGVQTLIQRS